jgi:hypothetical protein
MRILIVVDDAANRKLLKDIVSQLARIASREQFTIVGLGPSLRRRVSRVWSLVSCFRPAASGPVPGQSSNARPLIVIFVTSSGYSSSGS